MHGWGWLPLTFSLCWSFQCFSMCNLHWKEFIIGRLSKTAIVLTALNMWVSYKCFHIPQSQELATRKAQDGILQRHREKHFAYFSLLIALGRKDIPSFIRGISPQGRKRLLEHTASLFGRVQSSNCKGSLSAGVPAGYNSQIGELCFRWAETCLAWSFSIQDAFTRMTWTVKELPHFRWIFNFWEMCKPASDWGANADTFINGLFMQVCCNWWLQLLFCGTCNPADLDLSSS